jgi:magnesium chelatase subunit D
VVFLLDCSWSMAISERMEVTIDILLSLAAYAQEGGAATAVVTFHKNDAACIVAPGHNLAYLQHVLKNVSVGGKSPLSAGLYLARELIQDQRPPGAAANEALLVVFTDGVGNVSMGEASPQAEAYQVAGLLRADGVAAMVINMEHPSFDQGLSQELAKALGGVSYYPIGQAEKPSTQRPSTAWWELS